MYNKVYIFRYKIDLSCFYLEIIFSMHSNGHTRKTFTFFSLVT